MLSACLFCHRPFPRNQALERFPVARRIAYDPWRGRLWAVCPSCTRWTLAPFEERWEVLEDLERFTRGRARLLVRTDNIELLSIEDIEIVRVGQAALREESWWRYGREYAARLSRSERLRRRGKIVTAAIALASSGIPLWGDGRWWVNRARRRSFGRTIWRGETMCPGCGHAQRDLLFDERGELRIQRGDAGMLELWTSCANCGVADDATGHRLSGAPAEHALRRTLAYRNFFGAQEESIRGAMRLIESRGSPQALVERIASERLTIGRLHHRGALALEIALNADVERRLLAMELEELEERWREEEEIAAIADRL